ncbi:MAG: hypothetical protein JRE64_04075 [Deltaproteobacteria bacterium]|nr:hypothetical protein [Deltaproteobacteria bacterium]
MADKIRWGLDNPHPFSQMKTELIWEGKYDEYGDRRSATMAQLTRQIHISAILSRLPSNIMLRRLLSPTIIPPAR